MLKPSPKVKISRPTMLKHHRVITCVSQLDACASCDRVEVLPLILILLLVLLSRHRLNSFQDDGIYVMLPCSHHHTVDPGCAADSESVTVCVPCVSRVCPGLPPVSFYRVCPGSPGVFESVFLR